MAGTQSTKNNYQRQIQKKYTMQLRNLLEELPPFCKDYFRGIEVHTSVRTRINYAYDIRTFFRFLEHVNPEIAREGISHISLQQLEQLKAVDIEEYLEYLKLYEYNGKEYNNDERAIHRKLSALRSFYLYYQKHEYIQYNPTTVVDMPKLHDKEIIRLDGDEISDLLDFIENGAKELSGMKKTYFMKNKDRNIAIFTLLLGTGIRVSECVGLNVSDIDFKNRRIRIIRKGGKEDFVYFGDEVQSALEQYVNGIRASITPVTGHEDALFLSIQKKRMSVQSIENLVTDYASHVTTFKHITPHKLRSTYGTALYRETGDIYLVAEVLGHNDVNTTRKHYAAIDEDRKRMAADAVSLHKKGQT